MGAVEPDRAPPPASPIQSPSEPVTTSIAVPLYIPELHDGFEKAIAAWARIKARRASWNDVAREASFGLQWH